MLIWIVLAVVAVAVAAYALWPRSRGVVDGEIRQSRLRDKGRAENYNNKSGPNFDGRL